tara:strand:+ start:1897 stop:2421 length:525 start_codon:yes stop_codon:yes gene_type:complete
MISVLEQLRTSFNYLSLSLITELFEHDGFVESFRQVKSKFNVYDAIQSSVDIDDILNGAYALSSDSDREELIPFTPRAYLKDSVKEISSTKGVLNSDLGELIQVAYINVIKDFLVIFLDLLYVNLYGKSNTEDNLSNDEIKAVVKKALSEIPFSELSFESTDVIRCVINEKLNS